MVPPVHGCSRQPRPRRRSPEPTTVPGASPSSWRLHGAAQTGRASQRPQVSAEWVLCHAPQAEARAAQGCCQTQARCEGHAGLSSPTSSQSATTSTAAVPALGIPREGGDTMAAPLSLSLCPCLLSPAQPAAGGRCAARGCMGESLLRLLAAGGLQGPCPPCRHVCTLLHHCSACTRAKKDALPLRLWPGTRAATGTRRLRRIFPSCRKKVRIRCSHREFTIHTLVY